MQPDRFLIENKLWMITAPIGVAAYDFAFRDFLECRTPYQIDHELPGVARIGAFDDYRTFFEAAKRDGILLLNTPEEQERSSSLPNWYPFCRIPRLEAGVTQRSRRSTKSRRSSPCLFS